MKIEFSLLYYYLMLFTYLWSLHGVMMSTVTHNLLIVVVFGRALTAKVVILLNFGKLCPNRRIGITILINPWRKEAYLLPSSFPIKQTYELCSSHFLLSHSLLKKERIKNINTYLIECNWRILKCITYRHIDDVCTYILDYALY